MYSEKFTKAIDFVLKHEGGYVNDPNDSGGETKYGISKRSYPNIDIAGLTRNEATQIYYDDFWCRGNFEEIADESVVIKLFDLSVNVGISQAAKFIQRALRAVGSEVDDDGIIGPISIYEINATHPVPLIAALKSEAAGYYRLLANKNATQEKFLNGWLKRAYASV